MMFLCTKYSKYSAPFLGVFLLCGLSAAALDWPSQTAQIQSNFAWNNQGSPQLGDTFNAAGPVSIAGDGELVFVCEESSSRVSRLPSPLGAWVALDHGDDLLAVYARVESVNSDALPKKIDGGIVIANAGASGWSEKNGFYLSCFDRKKRSWVNPSLIITPKEDSRLPAILSVKLKNAAGAVSDLAQTRTLKQGHYGINVHAADTRAGAQEGSLAPFRIISSVNGIETGVLSNETFSARDGSLMTYRGGLALAKQIYAAYPAVEAGEVLLTRGQVNLAITVQDISGNAVNTLYRLFVE